MRFDVFYALGSLWGATPDPQVCTSILRVSLRAGVTAFVDVNVVPMDRERVLANHTVLVEGGRITALGPSNKVEVPAGATRIDGRGKYLLPGLGEMHSHSGYEAYRMFAYLANGVTTVRHLNTVAHERIEERKQRLKADTVLGPRSYFAPEIPWLGKEFDKTNKTPVPRPDSVATDVAAYKAQGYNYLLLTGTTKGTSDVVVLQAAGVFDSLLAAARRVGLPVASHDHKTPFEEVQAVGAGAMDPATTCMHSGRH